MVFLMFVDRPVTGRLPAVLVGPFHFDSLDVRAAVIRAFTYAGSCGSSHSTSVVGSSSSTHSWKIWYMRSSRVRTAQKKNGMTQSKRWLAPPRTETSAYACEDVSPPGIGSLLLSVHPPNARK